ncbi:hypothetical protein KC356_g98 [Hortaea werneckii]|nr:hypothetical protein KC356_g98 [Hortaea werneckii]
MGLESCTALRLLTMWPSPYSSHSERPEASNQKASRVCTTWLSHLKVLHHRVQHFSGREQAETCLTRDLAPHDYCIFVCRDIHLHWSLAVNRMARSTLQGRPCAILSTVVVGDHLTFGAPCDGLVQL